MQKIAIYIGAILLSILILPILIVCIGGYYDPSFKDELSKENISKVQEISRFEDEMIRILAKEVPSYYEDEALKAQAVIVRTYLMRRQEGLVNEGSLGALNEQEMRSLWQQDYDENYMRYRQAVLDTQDQVIYYEEELIEPVYHRSSGGMTRSAKYYYQMDIPYLQPVQNNKDIVETKVVKTRTEFVEILRENYPDIIIDEALLEYQIQIISRDESNYILEMQIGNKIIDANDLRQHLGLPSSQFTIHVQEDFFTFEVKGIGYGIGLSQNGANELAKEGYSYEQILEYYYKGIEINIFNKNNEVE